MRVLIADRLADGTDRTLRERGATVTIDVGLSGDSLAHALTELEPDVLVVRSTRVDAIHFESATRLALVIRAGAGINTIDVEAASRHGVFVANCPGQNATAVAELTIGHLINLDRRIADNIQSLRMRRWNKKEFGKARGLAGRTLAVVGCGQIGQEVIKRAQALRMDVVGWSRSLDEEKARRLGVRYVSSLVDAIRQSDAITVHLALTSDTRGIIGERAFDAMRDGALFINTSRGELVDHDALLTAVHHKNLRVGLDVYPDEPNKIEGTFTSPWADEPGIYGTHHIGASTEQAEEAVAAEALRIIEAYENGNPIPNCCNVAAHGRATHMLIVRHVDRVGALASVLDVLRDADHNVQEIQNLLFASGDTACARIAIVGRPGNETLATISSMEHVLGSSIREIDPDSD